MQETSVSLCAHCGAEFTPYRPQNKFCSKRCSDNACYHRNAEDRAARVRAHYRRKKMAPRPCVECGVVFFATRVNRVICSESCRRDRARAVGRRNFHRRRAAVSYRYTQRDIDRLLARHRGLCAYCGENEATEIDHVVPIARGGVDGISNLLPSCQSCNRAKTDKLLSEWRHGRKRRR